MSIEEQKSAEAQETPLDVLVRDARKARARLEALPESDELKKFLDGNILGLMIVALEAVNEEFGVIDERLEDIETGEAGLPFPIEVLGAYLIRVHTYTAAIQEDEEASYLAQVSAQMLVDLGFMEAPESQEQAESEDKSEENADV